MSELEATPQQQIDTSKSDLWTDLALTLPIFVLYHLGVVLMPMRNAADPVTTELTSLAEQSLPLYACLTVAIGVAFVLALSAIGRKRDFAPQRFLFIGVEGVAYALVMRFVGAWALEAMPLSAAPTELPDDIVDGPVGSVVMSLGAGFYEELTFRVALFGAGAWIVKTMEGKGPTGIFLMGSWAIVCALAFSGWHHIGPNADDFDMQVFVYRSVCGLVLTAIYAFRGFAPAVWTHVLYDVWAMIGGA
ncbi:MAG: CPBP family intramembrane metalloprotease [Polyangiaceae bacterium]|nr:CPBP family intramembrane metalloprotease [Polyangiaceae bacterium]